jgi:hypothetical protein
MSSSQREQRQAAILDGSASTVIIMDLIATLELKLIYCRLRARESHFVQRWHLNSLQRWETKFKGAKT